jgi:hypothetical protein
MTRHDLDVLSLFSGIVFVAVAIVGLTDALVLSVADLRWLGPLALVGFGIVLVVTSGGRRRHDPAPDSDLTAEAEDGTREVRQDG